MTPEEIQAEIDELTIAISMVRRTGQAYTISTGGGSRTVTLANYDSLIQERKDLQAKLAAESGTLGCSIRAGW